MAYSGSTPAALAKMGSKAVAMLARSERVSNRRFKEATGWEPTYPTVRQGWPAVVAAIGGGPEVRGLARPALGLLALVALELGVWAVLAPQSFGGPRGDLPVTHVRIVHVERAPVEGFS